MASPAIPALDKTNTPVVTQEDEILMKVRQVAEYTQLTTKSIYDMVADGWLPAVRLGRNVVRLRKSDVDAAFKPVRED